MLPKKTDKIMASVGLPIVAVAGFLMILAIITSSKSTTNENNAYIRVINCIVSKNASTRTQADIENCYLQVENELDIKLNRYSTN